MHDRLRVHGSTPGRRSAWVQSGDRSLGLLDADAGSAGHPYIIAWAGPPEGDRLAPALAVTLKPDGLEVQVTGPSGTFRDIKTIPLARLVEIVNEAAPDAPTPPPEHCCCCHCPQHGDDHDHG